MCMSHNLFIDPPLQSTSPPMEKDSLKEATCELIAEAKKTNALLLRVIEKIGSNGSQLIFKEDQQAFLEYWNQIPLRDETGLHKPLTIAIAAWGAALRWERGRVK